MFTTYNDVSLDLRKRFVAAKIPMPELESAEIMRFVTGKSREELVRDKYLYASSDVAMSAKRLAERRVSGEPLAYILGEWDFYGKRMTVTRDVLIPRGDTEILVDSVLRRMSGTFRFLDLGCGSGCIGIVLALMRSGARGVLADISEAALAVAKQNVQAHRLSHALSCVHADMFSAPPANLGAFDVIVSNPPYITEAEYRTLDPSVAAHEPALALLGGGDDGLDAYRAILENWYPSLASGGLLAFECGISQSDALADILTRHGLRDVQTTRDTAGINRTVTGFKAKEINTEEGF